jgi:hypothetical protein
MTHPQWCGKPCAECEDPCKLDESIPCSPDCTGFDETGEPNTKICLAGRCDVIINSLNDIIDELLDRNRSISDVKKELVLRKNKRILGHERAMTPEEADDLNDDLGGRTTDEVEGIYQCWLERELNISPNKAETGLKNNALYEKFAAMFPEFMSGEYSVLCLVAEHAKTLMLEWVFGDWISIAHIYNIDGSIAYEPLVMFGVSGGERTMWAYLFELSEPRQYDIVYAEPGKPNLQMQKNIHEFTSQWLDRAAAQGFKPLTAKKEIDGKDVVVLFDEDGKPFTPEEGA